MGAPVAPQEREGLLRQGHVVVLGAFAAVDVDHPTLAVHVGDLEGEGLREA
jgi:hypothetical protein